MSRSILLSSLFLLFSISILWGQEGIGTNSPNPSAALDIVGSDKGLLIPRISLTVSATLAPITGTASTSHNGMLAYNTSTATETTPGVSNGLDGVGVYVWNGTQTDGTGGSWKQIGQGGKFVDGVDPDYAVYTTGNVGIGTNSPTQTLSVSGTLALTGNATFTGEELTVQGSSTLATTTLRNDLIVQASDSSTVTLYANNENARVGIGTSTPIGALQINSTTDGLMIPRISLTSSSTYGLDGTGNATKNGMLIFNTNTSTDTLVDGLNGTGFYYWNSTAWEKIGIGAGVVVDAFEKDTTIYANDLDGTGTNSDTLEFVVAGTEQMRIDSQGHVGIGTATPLAALEVVSSDSGVLLPRISLTSSTTFLSGTATNDDNSLLVYNTTTATNTGLSGPGYYYWLSDPADGTQGNWVNIATGGLTGTTTDSTQRWDGTQWLENTALRSNGATSTTIDTALSVNGTTTITGNAISLTGTTAISGTTAMTGNLTVAGSGSATTTLFADTANHKVGIGLMGTSINAAATLDVNGDVYASGVHLTSDARYKTDIEPLLNALDRVLALRGVKHRWVTNPLNGKNFPDGVTLGFIAQELETVLPELVRSDAQGYKTVDYSKLSVLLVEAIKAQQQQIQQQEKRLQAIEQQLGIINPTQE